jgi:hypothetical protein
MHCNLQCRFPAAATSEQCIFVGVDPYRTQAQSDDRLAELIRVDAAKSSVRGARHLMTALCALSSLAPYLRPHALQELAIAVWAGSGLMALVCLVEEKRLGRVRIRELRKLGL